MRDRAHPLATLARAAVAAAFALSSACVMSSGAPPADGGGDAGREDASLAPAEPKAPRFAACPAGWVRDAEGQTAADPPPCVPWASDERTPCASGAMRAPGEAACRPVGAACPPAGAWPADLADLADAPAPGPTVVVVRAGAAPGGDGSRDRPLATLDLALYAGLAAAMGASADVRDVALRDVSPDARGAFGLGMLVDDGRVTAERLVIERVVSAGVAVLGGALTLDDAAIADVRAQPATAKPAKGSRCWAPRARGRIGSSSKASTTSASSSPRHRRSTARFSWSATCARRLEPATAGVAST